MKFDFRKTGIKILLIAIVFLVLLSKFEVDLNIRLFFGTLFIGTGLFLTIFGKFSPPDDEEEDEE